MSLLLYFFLIYRLRNLQRTCLTQIQKISHSNHFPSASSIIISFVKDRFLIFFKKKKILLLWNVKLKVNKLLMRSENLHDAVLSCYTSNYQVLKYFFPLFKKISIKISINFRRISLTSSSVVFLLFFGEELQNIDHNLNFIPLNLANKNFWFNLIFFSCWHFDVFPPEYMISFCFVFIIFFIFFHSSLRNEGSHIRGVPP